MASCSHRDSDNPCPGDNFSKSRETRTGSQHVSIMYRSKTHSTENAGRAQQRECFPCLAHSASHAQNASRTSNAQNTSCTSDAPNAACATQAWNAAVAASAADVEAHRLRRALLGITRLGIHLMLLGQERGYIDYAPSTADSEEKEESYRRARFAPLAFQWMSRQIQWDVGKAGCKIGGLILWIRRKGQ